MSSLIDDKALDARIQAMVEARVHAMMKSGAAQLPVGTNDETLLDAKQVRGPVLGGRSEMWLWRKQKDPNPETKFPVSDVVIARRRYWRFGTVRAWVAKQAANGKTADVRKIETAAAVIKTIADPAQSAAAPVPQTTSPRGADAAASPVKEGFKTPPCESPSPVESSPPLQPAELMPRARADDR